MSPLELVSCWVERCIPFEGDVDGLFRSFLDAGFVQTRKRQDEWRFRRGRAALTFDYEDDRLELQLHVRRTREGLLVKVGNWGFPPEPYLMKRRFTRWADQIEASVLEHGILTSAPEPR